MRGVLLILLFLGVPFAANCCPNDSTGNPVPGCVTPGNTMAVTNGVIDMSFPIYAPPAGNYNVLYTGSAQPKGSDDFSILDCGKNNESTGPSIVTYTLPTSTSSIFPPGHGVAFKNNSTKVLCTITATTSLIYGAAGVVNGNPAQPGGQFTLFPNGEASVQADDSNKYAVLGFQPGSWYQIVSTSAPSMIFYPLTGYPRYHMSCMGVLPVNNAVDLDLQTYQNGVIQNGSGGTSANYWTQWTVTAHGGTTPATYSATSNTGPYVPLTKAGDVVSQATNSNAGVSFDADFSSAVGTGAFYNDGFTYSSRWVSADGAGFTAQANGQATVGVNLSGGNVINGVLLQFNSGNISTGICWLGPKT